MDTHPQLTRLLAFLLAGATVFAYGLHIDTFVVLLGTLGVFCAVSKPGNAITLAVSLALSTLLLWAGVELAGLNRPFYRLHEKMAYFDEAMGFPTYRKNSLERMRMPFGDLRGMSTTLRGLEESREITCQTDDLGFRNTQPYHGQPYLVVGDSFVVGVGNPQEKTLDRQLGERHGIQAYNLGHPGDAFDYLQRVQYFHAHFKERPRILVFLFEGNDFPDRDRPIDVQSWLRTIKQRYAALARNRFSIFITMKRNQLKNWRKDHDPSQDPVGILHDVGGRDMAYYKLYRENVERTHYTLPPRYDQDLRTLLKLSYYVFFIPAKYRVYGPESPPLPFAYWEQVERLCREVGTPCLNLTDPLKAAARRHLEQGKTLWWRDDTHWNPLGIAVAADVVADVLRAEQSVAITPR
ncbi:MAG: SGNH/GDSL hydrolase family protein [Magnetococcales bacterium]|nr:SGNH/GDSL hydrolase family protein [Magnetococcales bacterium]